LIKERDTAIGLLRAFQDGTRTGSEVFDATLLGRFLAISELWDTRHAIQWNNIHFYYNPITAKIEPIGFDGSPHQPYSSDSFHALDRSWAIHALRDPEVAEAYVSTLDVMSRPDYLEQIRREFGKPLEQMQLALNHEFPFVRSVRLWELLEERQGYIRRSLNVTDLTFAFAKIKSANNDSTKHEPDFINTLQVEVRNVVALPVEIIGFWVGKSFIPADVAWIGSEEQRFNRNGESSVLLVGDELGYNNPLKYARFHIPMDLKSATIEETQLPEIKVVTRLLGRHATHEILAEYSESLTLGPMPSTPTVQEALAQHPFLEERGTEKNILFVRKGEWNVNGDLILPHGARLRAEPGTTLRFAHDAIFVATGPLEFRGTAEAPVVLAPKNDSWSGVVVLGAEAPSLWEHVVVNNTRGIGREGWILTGGITFYQSPVSLVNSRIIGSEAEDGLNIVLSSFEFRDCEFGNLASDAFDGDFTEGVIQTCNFHDVQGDAIDVSGSQVQVSDVVLRDIGDKALSVGEESRVEALDITAANIGIAVASKDLSQVALERVSIERATNAGLAAYMKKQEYGASNIVATDIDFSETPQNTLVQLGSWIELDGQRIEGTELDVKTLYEAGILGN
jgi:hypothetical protein